jgi:hypothetical protein
MTSIESVFRGNHRRILAMQRGLPTPSALPDSAPPAI